MSNLIPAKAAEKVERLRDSLGEFLDRWRPGKGHEDVIRRTDNDFRLPRILEIGSPDIDMVDLGGSIQVTAELPGLDTKDIQTEIHGRRLLLRGEKKVESEEKAKNYYYSECRYGSFSRWLPLPCEVDVDKVKARYKRGVLTVDLPKTAEAKTKRIEVKVH